MSDHSQQNGTERKAGNISKIGLRLPCYLLLVACCTSMPVLRPRTHMCADARLSRTEIISTSAIKIRSRDQIHVSRCPGDPLRLLPPARFTYDTVHRKDSSYPKNPGFGGTYCSLRLHSLACSQLRGWLADSDFLKSADPVAKNIRFALLR